MNIFSITDLRHQTLKVISAAKRYGYVNVVKNSKAEVVIADPKWIKKLADAYEELLDIQEAEKGLNSLKGNPPIPFSQAIKNYNKKNIVKSKHASHNNPTSQQTTKKIRTEVASQTPNIN